MRKILAGLASAVIALGGLTAFAAPADATVYSLSSEVSGWQIAVKACDTGAWSTSHVWTSFSDFADNLAAKVQSQYLGGSNFDSIDAKVVLASGQVVPLTRAWNGCTSYSNGVDDFGNGYTYASLNSGQPQDLYYQYCGNTLSTQAGTSAQASYNVYRWEKALQRATIHPYYYAVTFDVYGLNGHDYGVGGGLQKTYGYC